MRFRIHLERLGAERFLPVNYQYEVSSAVYKVIDRADSDFSNFLHRQGYLAFGKAFRLFTFSRLKLDQSIIIQGANRIEHKGRKAVLEIGFMIDRAAEGFIKGLFIDQEIIIGDKVTQVEYSVASIEAVAPPVFMETMQYRCLSPIFLRKKREDDGEDYLHPKDKGYGEVFFKNLKSKSIAFAGDLGVEDTSDDKFSIKPIGKIYKNGVTIKQHTPKATHLIAYMYEFELKASPELHETGYYAGFGHLGSQGFGCVEVKEGGKR